MAALVTTVAWAAPLGGQRPTAELSYGTHHIAPSDGRVTLTETVTLDEARPDEEYVLTATLHALGDDGSDRGAITVGGGLFEASASVVPADDGKTLSLPVTLDAKGLAGRSVVCFATLSKGGEVVASWQDIGDDAQTVRFPALSASLDGTDRGGEILAQESARVKATVLYANVVPGKIYRVTAHPGLRAWLQTVLARSSAVAPDASSLAATASRAITLVTCGSDLSGRRERTLVTFVA